MPKGITETSEATIFPNGNIETVVGPKTRHRRLCPIQTGSKHNRAQMGSRTQTICGEVRLKDLQEAILLKNRGYLVIPNPEDPVVQQAHT